MGGFNVKKTRRIMAAAMAAVMTVTATLTASAAKVSDFTDVSPDDWYYPAVKYATEEGLFAGTTASTFSPGATMTRGMFVTVLGRKNGIDESQYLDNRFDDVEQGDYYAPYVEWAARYGIVDGVSNYRFAPDSKITREQMATILYRYAQKTGNDTDFGGNLGEVTKFPDATQVSGWATQAMGWATVKDIINGSGGKLDPKGKATRAQVAQIFLNSDELLVNTEIDAEPVPPTQRPTVDLTDEEKASLEDWQDPTKVIQLVLDKTDATWDPSIVGNSGSLGAMQVGSVYGWSNEECAEDMLWNIERENIKTFAVTSWDAHSYTMHFRREFTTLQNGKPNTPDNVTAAIYAMMPDYPEGMTWTNCGSFPVEVWWELYGTSESSKEDRCIWENLKPGDSVRYFPDGKAHSVVVLSKTDDSITVVEGGYNGTIHWNRVITRAELESSKYFYREYVV
jgi:hypothetical protein